MVRSSCGILVLRAAFSERYSLSPASLMASESSVFVNVTLNLGACSCKIAITFSAKAILSSVKIKVPRRLSLAAASLKSFTSSSL